jgi:hypothetical protein
MTEIRNRGSTTIRYALRFALAAMAWLSMLSEGAE